MSCPKIGLHKLSVKWNYQTLLKVRACTNRNSRIVVQNQK
jgi:hypothetical protein